MSELRDLLQRLVPTLERSSVPFMIAGSFASAAHGLPRATQDLDIVIDPTIDALELLLRNLPTDTYYVDAEVARDSFRTRGMFNVIDHSTGWKIDFIFRRNRAFSKEEFMRRRVMTLLDVDVYVASPEDTIIAKLEWSKASGGSERQRRDIAGIIATMGESLDYDYMERWIDALGVAAEWSIAKETALT